MGQVASQAGFRVMAYDVPSASTEIPVKIRSLSRCAVAMRLNSRAVGQARRGGTVNQPSALPASRPLGMVKDRFGVTSVVDLQVASPRPENLQFSNEGNPGPHCEPFSRRDKMFNIL